MPAPQVIESIAAARQLVADARRAGQRVGLVPTMGALHEGHLSLVRRAKSECERVFTTIFVNPTQFGPHEDFERYPRTLAADVDLLAREGCDWVFVPDKQEMYPRGFSTSVEPPACAAPLEGLIRPGHFRGVTTVVQKLFGIIPADVAYFGQKDFQQALVIQTMVAELNTPIQVEVCPIVREPDGLAMSSRNRYLAPDQRLRAVALSRGLRAIEAAVNAGERDACKLAAEMKTGLVAAGIERIDYVTIADRLTLEALPRLDRPAVALVAAHVGTTRLIDNLLLDPR